MLFSTDKFFHRERHCQEHNKKPRCLVPKPVGYKKPFPWPKSRDYAWFKNVPFKKLTEFKKPQNWVRLEGDLLIFPGGGSSFTKGVEVYVKEITRMVPLKSGSIRTVLDVGCGVASFGAFLMDYNILTMSIAPIDQHQAQVQFALERGLPAMLGILSTHRLPFPSRSFDMAHCSRCLVQWTNYDGLYLIEIDRVLRPGGYWVLSGPPISWKVRSKKWEQPQVMEKEQNRLEDLARRLCWKKVAERGHIAVWRKPTNHLNCIKMSRTWKSPRFCINSDPDAGCTDKVSSMGNECHTFDAKKNNLSIVYERGLIGTYMNWCEAFDTYPRTYDLIHAYGVFSMYMNKCDILDILLEMYRILRPEGAVIIRDHVDIIVKLHGITDRIRWHSKTSLKTSLSLRLSLTPWHNISTHCTLQVSVKLAWTTPIEPVVRPDLLAYIAGEAFGVVRRVKVVAEAMAIAATTITVESSTWVSWGGKEGKRVDGMAWVFD
ncbi:hypothetical protein GH714_008815 [Hevea brasiliensis]|uniref:Methyltransferase n=1 Tax=Hevea brasiliensis TaxID=3981 RepID=A0A6A6NA90_HEVBR|nr:hypothetical protein GH714_008815 [Hevea brasiliensis]